MSVCFTSNRKRFHEFSRDLSQWLNDSTILEHCTYHFFFFLGERLFSNYGAKTSLENQVKQLRDDVNDKLENVRASLVSIASVLRDEKKPDQQLIEGETKLTEDTSSERLAK